MWHYVSDAVSHITLSDCALLVFGLLLALYVVGTWNYDYFQRRGIPSTKPKVPFFGDMLMFFLGRKSFPDVATDQYNQAKGHGVFGLFQLTSPAYLVCDPELLKVVCVKEFDSFTNHQTVQAEKMEPLFSKNLFNLKDQAWRDMRTTLSPAFTTSKIKGMFPLISECAHQMAQHLRQKHAESEEGNMNEPLPVDMKDLFSRLANDVIANTAFGVSCNSFKHPDNEFYKMGHRITNISKLRTIVFIGYIVIPKLMQTLRLRLLDHIATSFFDSVIRAAIRERKEKNIFRPDMLQLLMDAREGKLKAEKEDADEAEEVGAERKELTDEDISAQAGVFFFAGFDTVSTALCLTSHLLSHHEDIQMRLYEEVAEVMSKTKGKPTYESVQGMKYMDAVVNESLRLYPPVIVTDRVCREETQLPAGATSDPVTVRKGEPISIPVWGLHRDPEYWSDPETFDPERFNDENKHRIKPFTYMPFGAGPRLCIGQRFALIEVKLALVQLLTNFELHPCSKTTHPLELMPSFNVTVKGGYWCGLKPRVS